MKYGLILASVSQLCLHVYLSWTMITGRAGPGAVVHWRRGACTGCTSSPVCLYASMINWPLTVIRSLQRNYAVNSPNDVLSRIWCYSLPSLLMVGLSRLVGDLLYWTEWSHSTRVVFCSIVVFHALLVTPPVCPSAHYGPMNCRLSVCSLEWLARNFFHSAAALIKNLGRDDVMVPLQLRDGINGLWGAVHQLLLA